MKAEIISIGTELLLGEITDTNSAYLASQLPSLGIDLHFVSTVGDNQQRLVDTLRQACRRSDIVITTGGLGPTQDDITREAIADLLGEELTIDSNLVQRFQDLFDYYHLEMPPSNIKQAAVIPSARIIHNPRGTAPGWGIEWDKRVIITMPGPPSEMQTMWTKEILPKLQQRTKGAVIISKTLKAFGLSEAKVGELVSPYLSTTNPTLATYAKVDGVHLRITAKARERHKAQNLITRYETDIRKILGDYIWGEDSDTIESIIGTLLAEKSLSLSTMECGTGGILADMITNVSGSSTYFRGGLVAYSAEAEAAFRIDGQLISRYGIISAEVAEAMAAVVRDNLRAAIGIGITGVIGPSEIEGKQIGTIFIGINDGRISQNFVRNYPGNRLEVKQRAAVSALFELRKILLSSGH